MEVVLSNYLECDIPSEIDYEQFYKDVSRAKTNIPDYIFDDDDLVVIYFKLFCKIYNYELSKMYFCMTQTIFAEILKDIYKMNQSLFLGGTDSELYIVVIDNQIYIKKQMRKLVIRTDGYFEDDESGTYELYNILVVIDNNSIKYYLIYENKMALFKVKNPKYNKVFKHIKKIDEKLCNTIIEVEFNKETNGVVFLDEIPIFQDEQNFNFKILDLLIKSLINNISVKQEVIYKYISRIPDEQKSKYLNKIKNYSEKINS